jgi:hypothetical protein
MTGTAMAAAGCLVGASTLDGTGSALLTVPGRVLAGCAAEDWASLLAGCGFGRAWKKFSLVTKRRESGAAWAGCAAGVAAVLGAAAGVAAGRG